MEQHKYAKYVFVRGGLGDWLVGVFLILLSAPVHFISVHPEQNQQQLLTLSLCQISSSCRAAVWVKGLCVAFPYIFPQPWERQHRKESLLPLYRMHWMSWGTGYERQKSSSRVPWRVSIPLDGAGLVHRSHQADSSEHGPSPAAVPAVPHPAGDAGGPGGAFPAAAAGLGKLGLGRRACCASSSGGGGAGAVPAELPPGPRLGEAPAGGCTSLALSPAVPQVSFLPLLSPCIPVPSAGGELRAGLGGRRLLPRLAPFCG